MNTFTTLRFKAIGSVLVFLTALTFFAAGCDTAKEEKPADGDLRPDTTITDTTQQADTTQQVKQLPDLKGKWTGTLDGRATTLTISEQNENEFSGTIVIQYREVSTKAVSGTANFEEGTVKMRDTERFRYAGTYSGKLSEDNTKISGSFTITADNKSFPFSLTKK